MNRFSIYLQSREEYEKFKSNPISNRDIFSRNSPNKCELCGKVYEEVLPYVVNWDHVCYACVVACFYPQLVTYEGVVEKIRQHNEYWDEITGGDHTRIPMPNEGD